MELYPISSKYIYFTRLYYKHSGAMEEDERVFSQYQSQRNLITNINHAKQSELKQIIDSFTGPLNYQDKNRLQTKKVNPKNEKEARALLKECSSKIIKIFNVLRVDYTSMFQNLINGFPNNDVEVGVVWFGKEGLNLASKMINQTKDFHRTINTSYEIYDYFKLISKGKKSNNNLQSLLYTFTLNLFKDLAEEFNIVKILYKYIIVLYGKKKATQVAYRRLKKHLVAINDSYFKYTPAPMNDRKNGLQNLPKVSNVNAKFSENDDGIILSLHYNAQTNLYKMIQRLYGIFHTDLEIPELSFGKENLFTNEFKHRYANMAAYQVTGAEGSQQKEDVQQLYMTSVEPAGRYLADMAAKALAVQYYITKNKLGQFFYGQDEQVHSTAELFWNMELELPNEKPWRSAITLKDQAAISASTRNELILASLHKANIKIAAKF